MEGIDLERLKELSPQFRKFSEQIRRVKEDENKYKRAPGYESNPDGEKT